MLLSLASGFMLPRDARAAGARDVPLEGATAEAVATSGGSGVRRRLGGSDCDDSWSEATGGRPRLARGTTPAHH